MNTHIHSCRELESSVPLLRMLMRAREGTAYLLEIYNLTFPCGYLIDFLGH